MFIPTHNRSSKGS